MSDRELLELAAKAAGKRIEWVDNEPMVRYPDDYRQRTRIDGYEWNPRTDDGDSRRLEVSLMMTVCQHEKAVTAHVGGDFLGQVDVVGCRHDATRLAVLRCAAEIGRAMP